MGGGARASAAPTWGVLKSWIFSREYCAGLKFENNCVDGEFSFGLAERSPFVSTIVTMYI